MTQYLLLRGSTYYFNKRFHNRVLRLSLYASDIKVARLRVAYLIVLSDYLSRINMSFEQIRTQARQEALRLHQEWFTDELSGMTRQQLAAMHRNDAIIDSEMTEIVGVDEEELIPKKKVRTDEEVFKRKLVAWTELEFISLKNQTLEEQNPRSIRKYWEQKSMVPAAPALSLGVSISERLEEFLSDKKASKASIQDATLNEYRVAVREFIEIKGDLEVKAVRIEDAKDHRDSLCKLPKHRSKAIYKNKSAKELLAMEVDSDLCLSSKTVSGRLTNLRTYFTWLKQHRELELNPFEGVKIEVISESYAPYTVANLNTIFSSELFKDSSYRRNEGTRSNWWLVVLAAFTGARLGELAQLNLTDVSEKDGVVSIRVTDEGEDQRVKTDASIRTFPLHPFLLDLGFIEYIEDLRSRGVSSLLPSLPKKLVKSGDQSSKWYGRYKKSFLPADFKDERKVFHSFRHSFIQTASQCEAEIPKLQRIVGHEPAYFKETSTYIGEAFTQQSLLEELKKVQYEGLDLNLLRGGWQAITRP